MTGIRNATALLQCSGSGLNKSELDPERWIVLQVEERYTELVRGYLDFDVEMENVGVFWSGTEVGIV